MHNQKNQRTTGQEDADNGREEADGVNLERRAFLRQSAQAALPIALYGAASVPAAAQVPSSVMPPITPPLQPGLIIREKEPANLEFPFSTLATFVTPNEQFYIRNHFPQPKIEAQAWRLTVEGAVERPFTLTYAELMRMPSHTSTTMLECAGNIRVFLVPKAEGAQWELGGAGNAQWTGVPLAAILKRAGVRSTAVEVVLEGEDAGEIKEEPKSPGKIHFARSLPLEKARDGKVLLAYRMNGAELSASHGFPVRALVPGWYGMASVKWLTRIVVTERPFDGFFQSLQYSYFERRNGLPTLVPVTEMQVKAEIARPAMDEAVQANTSYRMHGAAWTGGSDVTKVEVSKNGGLTWAAARLVDNSSNGRVVDAWRLWEYDWHTPSRPGRYTVMARATDARGRVQPMERDPDRRSYMISHVLPIEIEVR